MTQRAYDAIIVLGSGVDDAGLLSAVGKDRVRRGVELYVASKALYLVMSGGYPASKDEPPPVSEAAAMRAEAVALGVPKDAIILEERSRDTIGNAEHTLCLILEPRGRRNLIVVTSDYHIPRAEHTFRTILGEDYTLAFEGITTPMSESDRERRLRKEEETMTKLLRRMHR